MPRLTVENTIDVLHQQAWSRAKGELAAMMNAIYDDGEYYDNLDEIIRAFIAAVEKEI